MNVMTREKQTYQDIGEPKVRFGASVRKQGYFAGHRVCLILALEDKLLSEGNSTLLQ